MSDEKSSPSGKEISISESVRSVSEFVWYDPSKESQWTRLGLSAESFKRAPGPIKRQADENLSEKGAASAERETPLLPEKFKPRHLKMMAVGGSIGTGLFIGTGSALARGGPLGVLIGWVVMGFMLFNVMQAMAELSILYPVTGGFYNLANRFVDKSWAFAMGWNYGIGWAVVLPLELTAASIVVSFWDTGVPQGVWITIFMLIVFLVALFGAEAYGEEEFFSACVKVFVAAVFIIFSFVMVFGGGPKHGDFGSFVGDRYWKDPGPLAHGAKGVLSVLVTAAFSYNGTELVGLAVTESPNPRKVMPGAVKMSFWRITMIYVVSLIFIGLLIPYNDPLLTQGGGFNARFSPFVIIVQRAGVHALAHVVNICIIVAIISIACSGVYAASRTFHALAEQGYAPKPFAYVDKAGRPLFATVFVCAWAPIAFINLGSAGPIIFDWLMAVCGLSALFTWGSICLSHIRFRRAWSVQGHHYDEIPYQAALGLPGTWCGFLLILLAIGSQLYVAISPVVGRATADSFFKTVLAIPVVIIMYIAGYIWKRETFKRAHEIDLVTGRKVWDTAEELNAERTVPSDVAPAATSPRPRLAAIAMSDGERGYDYTDGASALEIRQVLSAQRSRRRDSQVGSAYDDDGGGAVFGGPSASLVPSSVSTMHYNRPWGRRRSSDAFSRTSVSISRRQSQDEQPASISRGRQSSDAGSDASLIVSDVEDQFSDQEPEDAEAGTSIHTGASRSRTKRRGRRPASPESPLSRSVFENITSLFSSSRPPRPPSRQTSRHGSLASRRSSVAGSDRATGDYSSDGEERWGYSSAEEDSLGSAQNGDAQSLHDSDFNDLPHSPSVSLPLLQMHSDPFFGDTRIDIDMESRAPSPPPPPGPPSRQGLILPDEDMWLRLIGYEVTAWKQWVWRLCCTLSLGTLALFGHWSPRLWLRWVTSERAFRLMDEGLVVVETPFRDLILEKLKTIQYPYALSTAFPPSLEPSHRDAANGNGVTFSSPLPSSTPLKTLKIMDHRYSRDWRDSNWTSINTVKSGLNEETRAQRQALFGKNMVDVEGKPILSLLVEEVLHPFYVFQIASIILWSIDDYYYYAFCIALISAISIGSTLMETKQTIERMREMSRFSCPVGIYSEGTRKVVDSSELVPGDVVDLISPPLALFPADMVLLSGDAIVNESMLTGESVPVSKTPIRDEHLQRWKEAGEIDGDIAKGFLYCATKVVRVRGDAAPNAQPQALGLVVRTGFNTTKGSLVRSMIFPKPMGFKFYRDSIRFILFLSGLAGLGFLISAYKFVELGVNWHIILLRALDLITVVVPPALPATLSIGTSFAISRLRKADIFCISPTRVNVGGRVNVVCFDKTGTLTEEGLDVLGVRCPDRSSDMFGELYSEVHDIPLGSGKANFLYALATCHSLKVVDGETIGDPLDAKMFEFTNWTLEEGQAGLPPRKGDSHRIGDRPTALVQNIVRPPGSASFRLEDALKAGTRHAHFLELGVIRTFEFVSALRRMSVIVKRLKSTSMEVYVKGAPEVMGDICHPDSFPRDYDDLLAYYTKRGYRVIAIAGKSIEGLSWLKAQKMKREQAESDLRFLGLIIFENKLKPGTTPVIHTLRAAHITCRMVTGDNPRTAVSVARECGLVSQSAHVFYPEFIEGNAQTRESRLEWSSVDDSSLKLDSYSLKPLPPPAHHIEGEDISYQDYAMVLTGDVFRWMLNNAPLETLHRMLVKASVFARMSPDEKHELVERLQSLGYTVAFCGDGANDCGALKAADVGLSLSEAEASVAAPFTSRNPDISCMVEVIKEGRAALVTSFSCFKYMALYSLIQFTTITLLYSFASSLGDLEFLYIDLFIIIPIAVFMGRTHAFPRIHPQSPTASLVSKKVLSSIIGQVLLTSGVQFWTFFWTRRQYWYEPPEQNSGGNELETKNYENTTLFLVSSFQYILVAAVFSIGPPYRQPIWTNGLLMGSIVILGLFSTVILLHPPARFVEWLDLMPLEAGARGTLLFVVVCNVVMSVMLEKWEPVAQLVSWVHRRWRSRRPKRIRDGKLYKAVEGAMR
ncbi:hypothetical protein FRB99_008907 [Tulasnella sp. 403]|nr:hypothetical protein FRB99_008907 [Tulasnella sp. 403]